MLIPSLTHTISEYASEFMHKNLLIIRNWCFICRWSEIENIIHNKRALGLELARHDETVQFYMDDADTAKYVWRMCRTQWQFYRTNMENDL